MKIYKFLGRFRQDMFSQEGHPLSYSPEVITVRSHQYVLNVPLQCLVETEENYFVIKHEPFDLIGTGETQDEAENNFNEEFDFLYQKLTALAPHQMTTRLQGIKFALSHIVKEEALSDEDWKG